MTHDRPAPLLALLAALFLLAGPLACEVDGPDAPSGPAADADDGAGGDDDTVPGGDDDDDDDDDASGDDDDDDAVVSLETELIPSEVISTVGTLVWPVVDGASDAYAEFERADAPPVVAPAQEVDGEYRAVLFGLKPATEYQVRAVVEVDGQVHVSADVTFETGYAGAGLPGNISVSRDPERSTDGFFVTMALGAEYVAVVLDEDYEPVWWYEVDPGDSITLRAQLSRDRQSMLIQGDQVIWRVSLDGETAEALPIDSHHDFLELPDGTLAALEFEERVVDGHTVTGDRIVEYAPSGETRTVWSTFDTFDYDPAAPVDFPDAHMGWTHANVLRYDAERDQYAVSVRNFHTIVVVDWESGETLYRIGGDGSDVVTPDGDYELFYGQHGFQMVPGGILVYDNGSPERNSTMVVQYDIDLDSHLAELRSVYHPNPPLYNVAGGDVTRLASGNDLVTWSYLGRIEEVAMDGSIVAQMQMPLGTGFGYLSWVEDLYSPAP